MLFLLSAIWMLTGKFASLEEPTEVSEVAAVAVLFADNPKEIGADVLYIIQWSNIMDYSLSCTMLR
jgi:hypothetical protein